MKGDAGRIRQILLNLAGNAIKFTAKGEVSLEIKVLETGANGTRVRCEVRDTGIGIPADRLESLFVPFMQVDTSTTRRFGGTGLGLSIVRRLVKLMGGETGVESVEGEGSLFWFTAHFEPALTIRSLRPRHRTRSKDSGCWWWMTMPPIAKSSWGNCSYAASIQCPQARRMRRWR